MSGKNIGSLGMLEQAWAAASIGQNSTIANRPGVSYETKDIETLYDYIRKNNIGDLILSGSLERGNDDKLRKFYAVKAKDVYSKGDTTDIVIITDAKGVDIGEAFIEGEQVVFKIGENVHRANKAMLEAIQGTPGQNIQIKKIDDLQKILEPDNLTKLIKQLEDEAGVRFTDAENVEKRINEAKADGDIARNDEIDEAATIRGQEKGEHDKDKEDEEKERKSEIDDMPEETKAAMQEYLEQHSGKQIEIRKIKGSVLNNLTPNDNPYQDDQEYYAVCMVGGRVTSRSVTIFDSQGNAPKELDEQEARDTDDVVKLHIRKR